MSFEAAAIDLRWLLPHYFAQSQTKTHCARSLPITCKTGARAGAIVPFCTKSTFTQSR